MNFTQVSNHFIDTVLPRLSASAIVVYIVICRKTAGWHKQYDEIAISQFVTLTGLTKPTIIRAIRELIAGGIINMQSSGATNAYGISESIAIERVCCGDGQQSIFTGQNFLPVTPVAGKINLPDDGKVILPTQVKNFDQQKKQQKKQQNKQEQPRDARLAEWQFTVYRQLTHLHVPFAFRDEVAKLTSQSIWESVITRWIGRGYRPNGIQGMLEWYHKDMEKQHGRQNGQNLGRRVSEQEYIEANKQFVD